MKVAHNRRAERPVTRFFGTHEGYSIYFAFTAAGGSNRYDPIEDTERPGASDRT